jgi:glucan phosphoethanolaminetransferase (alkaline phosphatase superfamily)
MNEVILILLGFLGFIAAGCSIALLALGTMIDQFPMGNESKRERSLASPVETTKLSVALFWGLFIAGSIAVLQENRFIMIGGVTVLFAITLFMFTALIFSFAVLNTMRGKKKGIPVPDGLPVIQISPVPALHAETVPPAPVLRKRYNNPVTDFMLNALLKKE